MVLPINLYGHPILRKVCDNVESKEALPPGIVENMWETLENADGAGLAAPQIGFRLKLFIVNSITTFENINEETKTELFLNDKGIKETFINPKILSVSDEVNLDFEGCLSIPGIQEEVKRHLKITIEYFDSKFMKQVKSFSGFTARAIQHEYDHTKGILYIDHLPALKKKLLRKKLNDIIKKKVETGYKVKFT